MTDNELTRLLHEYVAEPPRALSPTTVLRQAKRRHHKRFAVAGSAMSVVAVAMVVVAVALAPSVPSRGGGSLVPADGGSSTGAERPNGCTTAAGGRCSPALSTTPTSAPTTGARTNCTYRPSPARDDAAPRFRQKAVGRDVGLPPATAGRLPASATLRTNRGDVALALRPDAVCTVNSFTHLVRHAYYDDTPCFRLVTEGMYLLQCGDPAGTGDGGPGYVYDDENLSGATYPAGTVAMANSGPASNGSQFFIVYKDSKLDPHYTVFGRVTAGLDVLTAVAAGGSTPSGDGQPNLPLDLRSVSVE